LLSPLIVAYVLGVRRGQSNCLAIIVFVQHVGDDVDDCDCVADKDRRLP
jgi:hypothetical protein